MVVIEGLIPDV